MEIFSFNDRIAIEQPVFNKIETQITNGFAMNSNRVNLVESKVVWNFKLNDNVLLEPGDYVVLKGDAGLHPWAKQKFVYDNKEFVLCSKTDIVGYKKRKPYYEHVEKAGT
ncbi:hypothetical protein EBU95_03725 [bacterium]|nr:hypothetical protein [bacterium]